MHQRRLGERAESLPWGNIPQTGSSQTWHFLFLERGEFPGTEPGFHVSASQFCPLGWGVTDLLHSCRKFPTDVNCIFKATSLAEPQLQPILSSILQLLPVPVPILQAMSLSLQPSFDHTWRERSPSSLIQRVQGSFSAKGTCWAHVNRPSYVSGSIVGCWG